MATGVTVSIDIPSSRTRVWEEVADLAGHSAWMTDARSIGFVTDSRSGVGTVIEVETRFGPLRTTDVIEVTAWDPEERIAVLHRGLFTGTGEFRLSDSGGGTRFTWSEQIKFPWFLLGDLGGRLAVPVLARMWRRNLCALRDRLSVR